VPKFEEPVALGPFEEDMVAADLAGVPAPSTVNVAISDTSPT